MTTHQLAFLLFAACWGIAIGAHTANLIHRGVYARTRRRLIRESVEEMRRKEAGF
jgi:hypothetical protein